MNNQMLRRRMIRDYARGRNRNGRYTDRMEDMRGGRDYHMPQMYSNEYGMGGRVFDGNTSNRYTPNGFDSNEQDFERSNPAYTQSDFARGRRGTMRDRRYDGHYYYPFEMMGSIGYEHDMASGDRLSEDELKQWSMRLLGSVDSKDRQLLNKEQSLKKAEALGISFDKFSESEYYVTVLMMFTDYHKTLGTATMDIYLRLAKDWLCDEDTALQYGAKLAAYYDEVVMAE